MHEPDRQEGARTAGKPAPGAPPDRPIRVIQISDSHLYEDPAGELLGIPTDASLQGVLRHVGARQPAPDLLLATGDISQDGSLAAQQRFLAHAAAMGAPVHGLPGNHDAAQAFHQAWGGRAHPVVDVGSWRIIMLDTRIEGSNAGRLADTQLDLLLSAATEAHDRHVLAAMHHNPVSVGSRWLDTMMIANAQSLFDVLQQLPQVRALVWGHVHQAFDGVYDFAAAGHVRTRHETCASTQQQALRLLATPSTCVQFTPGSQTFSVDSAAPGYRWLVLHPDGHLETGISRVEGLGFRPDKDSGGY